MDQNNEPQRITFLGEEFQRPVQSFQAQTPKIVEWVMKYSGGYIKDEKQATYVLIVFVVVSVIFTFALLFAGGNQNTPTAVQQEQLNKIERLQNSQ